jgi:hypothetical protein
MLFGKTAITFAYELGLRRILYKSSSTENFTHEIQPLWCFLLKLDFQNWPGRWSFKRSKFRCRCA